MATVPADEKIDRLMYAARATRWLESAIAMATIVTPRLLYLQIRVLAALDGASAAALECRGYVTQFALSLDSVLGA